jgi:hypothetical protein
MTAVQTTEVHGSWDQLITTQTCMTPKKKYIHLIYLPTAIEQPAGGSTTVHIYTQTKQRTTQNNTKIRKSAGRAPSLRGLPWHLKKYTI